MQTSDPQIVSSPRRDRRGRRQLGEERWAELLRELPESGLSQKAFADVLNRLVGLTNQDDLEPLLPCNWTPPPPRPTPVISETKTVMDDHGAASRTVTVDHPSA